MTRNLFYLLIISFAAIVSCKKNDDVALKGYIIAGEKGNCSNIEYSPIKLVHSAKIKVIENDVSKDSLIGNRADFDFNNDGIFDLAISSESSYPNQNSKALILTSNSGTFSFCNQPVDLKDTLNDSQNWIRIINNELILLSLSDSLYNNWSTPKYFGFKISNKTSNYYGWIKMQIDDFNQLSIYAYSCSK